MKKLISAILILTFALQSTDAWALRAPASSETGIKKQIQGAMHGARAPEPAETDMRNDDLRRLSDYVDRAISRYGKSRDGQRGSELIKTIFALDKDIYWAAKAMEAYKKQEDGANARFFMELAVFKALLSNDKTWHDGAGWILAEHLIKGLTDEKAGQFFDSVINKLLVDFGSEDLDLSQGALRKSFMDFAEKKLEDFEAICKVAERINPAYDKKALFEAFVKCRPYFSRPYRNLFNIRYSTCQVDENSPDVYAKILPVTVEATTDYFEKRFLVKGGYIEETRTYEDTDRARHYFVETLERDYVVPGEYAYFVHLSLELGLKGMHWSIDTDRARHYFVETLERNYVTPGEYEYFLQLSVKLGLKEMHQIIFSKSKDIVAEVGLGTRILGKASGSPDAGNKEKGFLIFEKLGLPYPSGIVLSSELARKMLSKTDEEMEDYVYNLEKYIKMHTEDFEELRTLDINDRFDVVIRSNPVHSMPGILETSSDPNLSLIQKIRFVGNSWNTENAKKYRQRNELKDDDGLSVIVQRYVNTKNPDRGSGFYAAGVFSTLDPNTGEDRLSGRFIENEEGKELMTGGESGRDIAELASYQPAIHLKLMDAKKKLEAEVGPQEVEFAVSDGELYFIQTRNINFAPQVEIAHLKKQLEKGAISEAIAIPKIEKLQGRLGKRKLYKIKDGVALKQLGQAEGSSPGVIQGHIVWSMDTARRYMASNAPVIFVSFGNNRDEVLDNTFGYPCSGLITTYGNDQSHEAVLARKAGIPALVNLRAAKWDAQGQNIVLGTGDVFQEGDLVIVDGNNKALCAANADALEEDSAVDDASYGISIPLFRQTFLKQFLTPEGAIREEYSYEKLLQLNAEALSRFKEMELAKTNDRDRFEANLEKHFLHVLLLRRAYEKRQQAASSGKIMGAMHGASPYGYSGNGLINVESGEFVRLDKNDKRDLQAYLQVCLAVAFFNPKTGERALAHFLPSGYIKYIESTGNIGAALNLYFDELSEGISGPAWHAMIVPSTTDLESGALEIDQHAWITIKHLSGYLEHRKNINKDNITVDKRVNDKRVVLKSDGSIEITYVSEDPKEQTKVVSFLGREDLSAMARSIVGIDKLSFAQGQAVTFIYCPELVKNPDMQKLFSTLASQVKQKEGFCLVFVVDEDTAKGTTDLLDKLLYPGKIKILPRNELETTLVQDKDIKGSFKIYITNKANDNIKNVDSIQLLAQGILNALRAVTKEKTELDKLKQEIAALLQV